MRNIVIGSYYPVDSFVHKLDPRIKIILTIALMVIVFVVESFIGYLYIGLFTLFAGLISKIPLFLFVKSLKPVVFLVVFTFIINLLFMRGGEVIFSFWIIKVYSEGLRFSVFMALRLIFMVITASVMTLTTTPVMLSRGLERLMSPLKAVKFPVHEMSMMMTIALRFIPTLVEEMDKIRKAQMSRGADFENGGLVQKAKSLIPLLIPLFISAFRRADELAVAMEARCYRGDEGRTTYRVLKLGIRDYFSLLFVTAFGVIIFFFG